MATTSSLAMAGGCYSRMATTTTTLLVRRTAGVGVHVHGRDGAGFSSLCYHRHHHLDNNNSTGGGMLLTSARTAAMPLYHVQLLARPLSTKDVFLRDIPAQLAETLPTTPLPEPPPLPLAELVATGHSVLEQLGLWEWWKPSSVLRWGLEMSHYYSDLPWWATIIASTVLIRLTFLWIPIKLQRHAAQQRQHNPQLLEFKRRVDDAQREGNNMLVQQIMMEQRDYFKKQNLSAFAHFPYMMANGAVFMTQFFAYRRMTVVKYPLMQEEGALWFKDLTIGDPYWVLPLVSAVSLHLVVRTGLETGSIDQWGPVLRYGMLYAFPISIFVVSGNFPSALCLYWMTNNIMSIGLSLLFQNLTVRKLLKLPNAEAAPLGGKAIKKDFSEALDSWRKMKTGRQNSPAEIRQQDMEQFLKAGRAKPVIPQGMLMEKKEEKAAAGEKLTRA